MLVACPAVATTIAAATTTDTPADDEPATPDDCASVANTSRATATPACGAVAAPSATGARGEIKTAGGWPRAALVAHVADGETLPTPASPIPLAVAQPAGTCTICPTCGCRPFASARATDAGTVIVTA